MIKINDKILNKKITIEELKIYCLENDYVGFDSNGLLNNLCDTDPIYINLNKRFI